MRFSMKKATLLPLVTLLVYMIANSDNPARALQDTESSQDTEKSSVSETQGKPPKSILGMRLSIGDGFARR